MGYFCLSFFLLSAAKLSKTRKKIRTNWKAFNGNEEQEGPQEPNARGHHMLSKESSNYMDAYCPQSGKYDINHYNGM